MCVLLSSQSAELAAYRALTGMAAGEDLMRDQEAALVKLGHLYRDEKYVDHLAQRRVTFSQRFPLDQECDCIS